MPKQVVDDLATDALKPVALAFGENYRRLAALSRLPLAAYAHGRKSAAEGENIMEVPDPLLGPAMHPLTQLHGVDDKFSEGIQALTVSVLIGAWSAFEVLATDAWIAAVNLRPKSLGVNALLSPRTSRPVVGTTKPEDSDNPKRANASITLNTLLEYGFNLKDRLGEMLWRKQHFSFNSLDGIKLAYEETFCARDKAGATKRSSEQRSWFEGEWHDRLAVLQALRHVFVHRSGKADAAFRERVGSLAAFAGTKIDERVIVENPVPYVNAAKFRARILLAGVDAWMKKPEP